MINQPSVVVGIDDSTVVVGFHSGLSQVWHLPAGRRLRELAGRGADCRALASLSGRRAAVGCCVDEKYVVDIFDVDTGTQLQELPGFGNIIFGLQFVEDHLLAMTFDRTLHVWVQDPAGKVRIGM